MDEFYCSLCGRAVSDTGNLGADGRTGDMLCPSCAGDWSADTFHPDQLLLVATATRVHTRSAEDVAPPPFPRMNQLVRVVAVDEAFHSEFHEVRVISLELYTDGFLIRISTRYPVGEGARPEPSPDTIGFVHAIAASVTDDCGADYSCLVECGGGSGAAGDWNADGKIRCWPAPAAEATILHLRVELPPGHHDRAAPALFDVPLTPPPRSASQSALARLAALAAADVQVPVVDPLSRSTADLPDLLELRGVAAVGRSSRAGGVTFTVVSVEDYAEGINLDVTVGLDGEHPDALAFRAAQLRGESLDQWPHVLNANCLSLIDDRGNLYPLRFGSNRGDRTWQPVVLKSPRPLDPAAVALRLDAPELIWNWSLTGTAFERKTGLRYVIDPGPFTITFLCRPPDRPL